MAYLHQTTKAKVNNKYYIIVIKKGYKMTIDISATKRSKDFFGTLEEKLYSIHGDKYLMNQYTLIQKQNKNYIKIYMEIYLTL